MDCVIQLKSIKEESVACSADNIPQSNALESVQPGLHSLYEQKLPHLAQTLEQKSPEAESFRLLSSKSMNKLGLIPFNPLNSCTSNSSDCQSSIDILQNLHKIVYDSPEQRKLIVTQPETRHEFSNSVTVVANVKCKLCDKLFQTARYMKRHLARHFRKKSFPCKYCTFVGYQPSGLKEHMRKHTGEKPFSCDLCTEAFTWNTSLQKHKRYAHLVFDPIVCQVCKKEFAGNSYLREHQILQHSDDFPIYRCEECGKTFMKKSILSNHMVVHTDERPHQCSECGKTFKSLNGLNIHMKNNHLQHDKMRFSCEVCVVSFRTKNQLVAHMASALHSGVKTYTCSTCGKSFARETNLKQHEVIHSNLKPFKCNQCDKAYSWKSHLTGHVRSVHEGLKAHQCEQCSKNFTQRSGLRLHMRTVHKMELPYSRPMQMVHGVKKTDDSQSTQEVNHEQSEVLQPVATTSSASKLPETERQHDPVEELNSEKCEEMGAVESVKKLSKRKRQRR